jgi:hypothetical protein
MIELRCICGHLKEGHEPTDSPRNPPGDSFCNGCCHERPLENVSWHDFKLDNLRYIETLAQEKGLV